MTNKQTSLAVPKSTQVRVVEDLIETSRLTSDFYLMLVLSSVVVVLGLLVGNSAVIIGGMLITPLLTPLLTLALGVVVADKQVIWRSAKIVLKSIGIILGVALNVAFLFPSEPNSEVHSRLTSSVPYFLVAFAAGMAATFAWVKKNLSVMLPGVAIAVSLVPPLAVVGIGLAELSPAIVRGSLTSFLLNLFGVVLGSVVIFSLLNFRSSKKAAKHALLEEQVEEKEKRNKKLVENFAREVADKQAAKEYLKEEIKQEVKQEIKKEQ